MTQNEMYAYAAVIAFIAFAVGRGQHAKAMTDATLPDPLGWLNGYASA